ncbi:glycosyltransferase [Bradyrhizobium sp. 138]|uniref:glycosyltransferase family 2 protein n=1 Tax=Bradyrhizobium sp. 138 TaxID=2782615 RepID=UPI001FF8E720|nr:glycosyltransferase [Bradyrhizobium sp. 138]MCK1737080.1 glycosyltransferase [Bradyrhizobium sp. 138]
MPLFSLVLPTLRRPDTFQYALRTLVNQTQRDFEIVVQNNGRDRQTEDIIASLGDDRIRHFWSDEILPMSRNWELALSNARGEYITFIGDDDGLFSDACQIASGLIGHNKADIVSWRPFSYYWGSHIISERKNRLLADVHSNVEIKLIDSRQQLLAFYNFKLHYSQLPMIYNSFVSRSLVDQVIKKTGRYFLGVTPDVTSGIVNAACSKQFILINRPLSIAGLSGHSTGHNVTLSPPGWISAEEVKVALGHINFDSRLVPANNNLEMMLANDALLVRDLLFLDDKQINIDFRRLAQSVASAINDRPWFYQETMRAVEELAAKHHFSVGDISFPAPIDCVPPMIPGETPRGEQRTLHIIDCDAAGIDHVSDAVAYTERNLLKPLDDVKSLHLLESTKFDIPSAAWEEKLFFCEEGNGVPGLEYGWGAPETWGTWSINNYMLLRFGISGVEENAFQVECCMRAFLYQHHKSIDFECRSRNTVLFRKTIMKSGSHIHRWEIPLSSRESKEHVELEFRVENPTSPAELGASADTRLLGIGLEWLRIVRSNQI